MPFEDGAPTAGLPSPGKSQSASAIVVITFAPEGVGGGGPCGLSVLTKAAIEPPVGPGRSGTIAI